MRVLLASDGSKDANRAAEFVSMLAANNPVDLHVLTVSCAPARVGPESSRTFSTDWDKAEQEYVQSFQAQLKEPLAPRCDSLIMSRRIGPVAQTILDESVGLEADVIVIGARGHSLIHRMLLGSISDHVAAQAKCSVAVIRDRDDADRPLPAPTKLLAGYDRSKGSREAISEIMGLHWPEDTEVNVMSVAPLPLPFESDPAALTAFSWEPKYLDSIRRGAERMASRVAEQIPHSNVQITRSNHPGSALVRAAEENESDLIFIGDTGQTLLDEWIMGSTSKYVVRHALCSVWISRHHRKSIQSIEDVRDSERVELGVVTP